MRYFVDTTACLHGGGGDGGVGLLGFLNGRHHCRFGFRLIGSWGSHCQAWWKPNAAMSNFINIVAGGTCWTCLLSPLQLVGNVPDLLTPPGASAAGAPQPMQPIPSTPLCVYCVRVCVCECAFVPVCVYTLPHGHLSFPLSQSIFQLRHTQSHTLSYEQLHSSLPFTRNSQSWQ